MLRCYGATRSLEFACRDRAWGWVRGYYSRRRGERPHHLRSCVFAFWPGSRRRLCSAAFWQQGAFNTSDYKSLRRHLFPAGYITMFFRPRIVLRACPLYLSYAVFLLLSMFKSARFCVSHVSTRFEGQFQHQHHHQQHHQHAPTTPRYIPGGGDRSSFTSPPPPSPFSPPGTPHANGRGGGQSSPTPAQWETPQPQAPPPAPPLPHGANRRQVSYQGSRGVTLSFNYWVGRALSNQVKKIPTTCSRSFGVQASGKDVW